MDYDEHFETLDDLLSTINGAVQDRVETDTSDTAGPYFSYMFDKDDGVFDDTDLMPDDMDSEDMETEAFTLSPWH